MNFSFSFSISWKVMGKGSRNVVVFLLEPHRDLVQKVLSSSSSI
jgi:hypothetical protein